MQRVLTLLSFVLLSTTIGCSAPQESREGKGSTTSSITECGADEYSEVDESGDAEDVDGLTPQALRTRANVCTPQNPRGDEERCANGGIPPRCEVLTTGPTADARAEACAQARLDERFARSGPLLSPAQNRKAADAAERIRAFCDD